VDEVGAQMACERGEKHLLGELPAAALTLFGWE
jgi:hypothetical protein